MSKYTTLLPRIPDGRTVIVEKHDDLSSNPFVCQDKNLLTYMCKEKEERTQKKILSQDLKVCDKTFPSRAKPVSFPVIDILENDARPNEDKDQQQQSEKHDQQLILSRADFNQVRRQTLRDFIAQGREMFRTQFSINTKQDAIREMRIIISKEREKISEAEQKLEEDAEAFEEFLKETDRNVADTSKLADKETKAKFEKIAEIRKVTAEILALKSDVDKSKNILKEYKLYENFLSTLSPSEWHDAQNQKGIIREAAKKRDRERRNILHFSSETKRADGKSRAGSIKEHRFPSHRLSINESRRSPSSSRTPSELSTEKRETHTGDSDSEEEPELYFTDPKQLHQIFAELEEKNAILLNKAQELDETLKDIKARKVMDQERMSEKIQALNKRNKMFSEELVREQEQIAELELNVNTFTCGNLNLVDQDKMLSILRKKVTDVYTCCIGEVQATLNTVEMLSSIEHRLVELQDLLELLPKEIVEAAQKTKLKEMRIRLHKEKIKVELVKQEKRRIRTLERATAYPCKTEGRKLMKRSELSAHSTRQKKITAQKLAAQKEADYEYFFT